MAEETSVELGKSLLAQQQKRTRRLQKSADKKFYASLGIGAYDAYSKSKGTKAYEELYSSFEPLLSQRANELEQSLAFKAQHKKYLNPTGQGAPIFGENQWSEALLYNHVMGKVSAAKAGDSTLEIDVQKEMDKVRSTKEFELLENNYKAKLDAANSIKLTKTIDDEGKIVYSDPLQDKMFKVAKNGSKNFGIFPDFLRLLGVGTSADLATQTFTDKRGVSYEILLPEADTPAKQKLQAALLAEMERGTFDEASEAEIASGFTRINSKLSPASKFKIDLAELSKMPEIATSINDIQNGRTEYPAYIKEAVYTTAEGEEHDYTTILESFDTDLEKENFYRDWKRTSAQMYNVITDPKITTLGGGITQDKFMQMAFEELFNQNKTTLEAGTLGGFFGINTRYESMSPKEQYDLVTSLVERYTAAEEDNLSIEDKKRIEERTQQFEQATIEAERQQPNNLVYIANQILEKGESFESEEKRTEFIEGFLTGDNYKNATPEDQEYFKDIVESMSIKEDILGDNNKKLWNELAKELYGVESYKKLTNEQFEKIKNPIERINELATNITNEYYNKDLPGKYNYSLERFKIDRRKLTIEEKEAYEEHEEKTPFKIAKEWWKERGIAINNFKAISKYLYNNISLLGTFRELNFDPVAFAFQQQGLELPDMSLSLKERAGSSLLDREN